MQEIYRLHPLERKMLSLIHKNINEILVESEMNEMEIMQGIQMLAEKEYVTFEIKEKDFIYLSEIGKKYINEELPEIKSTKTGGVKLCDIIADIF